VFKIIESEVLTNRRHIHDALLDYRAHGSHIALDDIGTGYSSPARLSTLQPDFAKVDCQLARGIATNPVKQAVMAKLVDLSHQIGTSMSPRASRTKWMRARWNPSASTPSRATSSATRTPGLTSR